MSAQQKETDAMGLAANRQESQQAPRYQEMISMNATKPAVKRATKRKPAKPKLWSMSALIDRDFAVFDWTEDDAMLAERALKTGAITPDLWA